MKKHTWVGAIMIAGTMLVACGSNNTEGTTGDSTGTSIDSSAMPDPITDTSTNLTPVDTSSLTDTSTVKPE